MFCRSSISKMDSHEGSSGGRTRRNSFSNSDTTGPTYVVSPKYQPDNSPDYCPKAMKRTRSSVTIMLSNLGPIGGSPSPQGSSPGSSLPSLTSTPEGKRRRRLGLMAFCAAGIYTFYIYYGLQQEKLYATDYSNGDGDFFEYTLVLVFVQCIINVLVACLLMLAPGLQPSKSGFQLKAFTEFAPTSFAYISATICSNAALHYIDYPTQVLAKSCKMIPVMLFGVFYNRIRYKWAEYLWVFLVTLGIALFLISNQSSGAETSIGASTYEQALGQLLVFASLVLDGVTGATQDRMVAKHLPSSLELMAYQNTWGGLLCFFALLTSGEGHRGIAYLFKYRACLIDIIRFSTTSAAGQCFIFLCIRQFDALFCTTITTTRKFFTILASVLWYQHHLSMLHWTGVLMVFAGLMGKIHAASSGKVERPRVTPRLKAKLSDNLRRMKSSA